MATQRPQVATESAVVKGESAVADAAVAQQSKKRVTNEELSRAWMAYALSLPENERALADRMKIMQPSMNDDDSFTIAVDNELVADVFDKESKSILQGLAAELQGVRLRMNVKVNKVVVQRRVYDRTKQFDMLKTKNPVIGKLRDAFQLELS
jgi:DNA polymerase-3 subunit gamma/tau